MPTIDEIQEGYFNYLVNVVLNAVSEADGYDCVDFTITKVELLINLKKLLESKKSFNEKIKILSLYERNKK